MQEKSNYFSCRIMVLLFSLMLKSHNRINFEEEYACLRFFRSTMTRIAYYFVDCIWPCGMIRIKECFVEVIGHLNHFPGPYFFRHRITCKIKVLFPVDYRPCGMAKGTFHSQGCFKMIHHGIQLLISNVLWQHF